MCGECTKKQPSTSHKILTRFHSNLDFTPQLEDKVVVVVVEVVRVVEEVVVVLVAVVVIVVVVVVAAAAVSSSNSNLIYEYSYITTSPPNTIHITSRPTQHHLPLQIFFPVSSTTAWCDGA